VTKIAAFGLRRPAPAACVLGFRIGFVRYSPTHRARRVLMWIKPKFVELRFGFEVTMYSEYR